MARLFDDVQSEYLERAQAVLAAVPLAMVCMFNSNDLTIDQTMICISRSNSQGNYFSLGIVGTEAGDLIQAATVAAGFAEAETTTGCSVNTWHHACGIYVHSTDRRAFIDGGSKGTNAGAQTPGLLNRTAIGRLSRATPIRYFSGMVAEAAVYNLSAYPGATDSDKADYFEANILPHLAAGEPPGDYTTGLIGYWPLRDDDLDYADDFDMTPYNIPSWATHPTILHLLDGTISAQSGVTGNLTEKQVLILAGLIEAQSGVTGNLQWLQELAGTIGAQSSLSAELKSIEILLGAIAAQSTLVGDIDSVLIFNLAGSIAVQSGVTGYIKAAELLSGIIEAQSNVAGKLRDLSSLSGTVDAQVSVAGNLTELKLLAGLIAGQSNVLGNIESGYKKIPAAMHKDLIGPYGDMGAWLWLVEIVVPTQATQRIARNTATVVYGVTSFAAGNFDPPGRIPLAGDGSIPRIQLRVAQDGTGTLEGIVNATKGGEKGTVKLIRTCEKYFNSPVKALERTYDILTAGSDPMWVTFLLGIPNPLTQRIPLWSYSSKVCPLATPSLFKGPRCQYPGEDAVCTGLLSDCRTKGNEVHWGAEVGLDPNAVRI